MTDTSELKDYTVCAAFYATDSRATATVQARSFEEACEIVVGMIDDGTLLTDTKSFDPTPTFVYGVVEGDGDPFQGQKNVPLRFQEPEIFRGVDPAVTRLIRASRAVIDGGRPSTLSPVLSRALDELAESLAPFREIERP